MHSPFIIVIAGPNGVGKTTFARRYLALIPECEAFVNADEIAETLHDIPTNERNVNAGRRAIERMDELIVQRRSFAFESTLSGKSLAKRLIIARETGYSIVVLLLWTPTVEETILRIHQRVQRGGHDIPMADIVRRFDRCYENFHEIYKGICHEWTVYDASLLDPRPIQQAYSDSTQGRAPFW